MKTIMYISMAILSAKAFAITSPVSTNTSVTGTDICNGSLTINTGVTLTIGNIATSEIGTLTVSADVVPALTNNGKIIVNAGSSFVVSTTASKDWGVITYSGNMDIYGSASVSGGADNTNGYNFSVQSGKTLKVFLGGTLIYLNGAMHMSSGTIILESGSLTKTDKIVLAGSGNKLTIGGDDVLESVSGGVIPEIILGSNSSSTIDASSVSTFSFSRLTLQNNSTFTLIVPKSSGSIFEIGNLYFNGTTGATGSFLFQDFRNDTIKIDNYSNCVFLASDILQVTTSNRIVQVTLSLVDSYGSQISLSEGQYWTITDNGFLNVVPEPATFSAILASMTLFWVTLRKRYTRKQ